MRILAADIGGTRTRLFSRHDRGSPELPFSAVGLSSAAQIAARSAGQEG